MVSKSKIGIAAMAFITAVAICWIVTAILDRSWHHFVVPLCITIMVAVIVAVSVWSERRACYELAPR
jgi:apolipoprotein N-acyltransferase